MSTGPGISSASPAAPDASSDALDAPDAPHAVLAARADRWRATYDPRALWPGLEWHRLQPAADAIARVVSARLRGESMELGAADDSDAAAIGVAAHLSGTGPLLGQWVERGELDVSRALASFLARHRAHGRARTKRITAGVLPVLARFVDAGITPVVIKGFHTAHVYFDEPSLRPMADVDVVVSRENIGLAEEILRASGFTPSPTILRPYKRDWFPPDHDGRFWSFEVFHERDPWKLELHDGANFGYLRVFGFRLDGGVRLGAPWEIGGLPARVPAQPLLTAMLAIHQSVEPRNVRLLRVLELALVIRRDRAVGHFDWAEFEAFLEESGTVRFVYPALALVEQLAPGTVDASLLTRSRQRATRLTRFMTSRMTPSRPILDDRATMVERLMWVEGVRDLIQRVRHFVNPYPGSTWREMGSLYHVRARRILHFALSTTRIVRRLPHRVRRPKP